MKQILLLEEDKDTLLRRSDEILDLRKQGKKVQWVAKALKDTMRREDVVMLSAPWIGYLDRIFVINFSGVYKTFVNPVITACKDFCLNKETTPIIPNKTFLAPRYATIDITYQDAQGKVLSAQFVGYAAYLIQQAVDSLEGVTLDAFALELPDNFDSSSDEEKNELIRFYLESIDVELKGLKQEIENDEQLSQMKSAVDFMISVSAGETKLEGISYAENPNYNNTEQEEIKNDE